MASAEYHKLSTIFTNCKTIKNIKARCSINTKEGLNSQQVRPYPIGSKAYTFWHVFPLGNLLDRGWMIGENIYNRQNDKRYLMSIKIGFQESLYSEQFWTWERKQYGQISLVSDSTLGKGLRASSCPTSARITQQYHINHRYRMFWWMITFRVFPAQEIFGAPTQIMCGVVALPCLPMWQRVPWLFRSILFALRWSYMDCFRHWWWFCGFCGSERNQFEPGNWDPSPDVVGTWPQG